MSKVSLCRIGSDPEFLLVTPGPKDNTYSMFPAERLSSPDRHVRIESWIGTDGHAATAEIRPAPCHNVRFHLVKIADALREIDASLYTWASRKGVNLQAIAQPFFNREPMGGHIWVSIWYKDSNAYAAINQAGYVWNRDMDDFQPSGQRLPTIETTPERLEKRVEEYARAARAGKTLDVRMCLNRMNYLILPFEHAFWVGSRTNRDGIDPIRLPEQQNIDNMQYHRPDFAYFRFEHRVASTWLYHPTLAYCNFALAKLSVLNWDNIPEGNNAPPAKADGKPYGRADWRALLMNRLLLLYEHPDFRISNDLKGLRDAIQEVLALKVSTNPVPMFIDFPAWAQVNSYGG